MYGRNEYIGGAEADALIGNWHQIVGADVGYTPYARYGQPNPYAALYAARAAQHHHPHRHHHHGFHGYYQPSLRDQQRTYWQQRARVSGGADQVAIGALALMGAEEAQAAAMGAPPPGATTPPDPSGPPPTPPGSAAPVAPPDMALAPPALPPPSPERHHHHHHRHHGGGGGGWQGWPITPRNAMIEYPGPSRADRVVLPMSSGVNILPNTSAQITSRPQNVAFRPERLIIGGTPGDWIVNDVKVGNRSQFSQSGDVPGEMFAATTIDSFVSFETVQTAMDFVVLVTFVGASESGSPFVCGVLGTAAI